VSATPRLFIDRPSLRAAPRTAQEKHDAADLTLKTLVWCMLARWRRSPPAAGHRIRVDDE